MCGLRSVGSRHMHNLPFGFLTTTNEFSHSGALALASSSLVSIPWDTMLSNPFWNYSFRASGTHLGGFCTGNALCFNFIDTGSHLSLPISLKSCWYLGWLMIQSFMIFSGRASASIPEMASRGAVNAKKSQVVGCIQPNDGFKLGADNKEFLWQCLATIIHFQHTCAKFFDLFLVVSHKMHSAVDKSFSGHSLAYQDRVSETCYMVLCCQQHCCLL